MQILPRQFMVYFVILESLMDTYSFWLLTEIAHLAGTLIEHINISPCSFKTCG